MASPEGRGMLPYCPDPSFAAEQVGCLLAGVFTPAHVGDEREG